MNCVEWTGSAPEPELRGRLEQAGWQLGTEQVRAHVVHTAQARLPAGRPPAGPWVWLSGRPPAMEALRQAVERGAVDVLCTGDAGWEERLVRRLGECLVAEPAPPEPDTFVARSAAARALLARIGQAARTSMPVLLTGETGTGKEVAARLIHQWSERRTRTFVPINCAAIPNELMEGELFGYAKGAFSGAVFR